MNVRNCERCQIRFEQPDGLETPTIGPTCLCPACAAAAAPSVRSRLEVNAPPLAPGLADIAPAVAPVRRADAAPPGVNGIPTTDERDRLEEMARRAVETVRSADGAGRTAPSTPPGETTRAVDPSDVALRVDRATVRSDVHPEARPAARRLYLDSLDASAGPPRASGGGATHGSSAKSFGKSFERSVGRRAGVALAACLTLTFAILSVWSQRESLTRAVPELHPSVAVLERAVQRVARLADAADLHGMSNDISRTVSQGVSHIVTASVPPPVARLRVSDVRSVQRQDDTGTRLVVRGTVANDGRAAAPAPRLDVVIRGENGVPLYTWRVKAGDPPLEPGEARGFTALSPFVPQGARDVRVTAVMP